MNDDQSRRARDRDFGVRERVDNLPSRGGHGTDALVLQLYDGGQFPSVAAGQYVGHPGQFTDSPSEGAGVVFTADTSRSVTVTVWGGTPAVGDLVVAHLDGGRWHARMGAGGSVACSKVQDISVKECYKFAGAGVTVHLQVAGVTVDTQLTDSLGTAHFTITNVPYVHYTAVVPGYGGYVTSSSDPFDASCLYATAGRIVTMAVDPALTCAYDICCELVPPDPGPHTPHAPWPASITGNDGHGGYTLFLQGTDSSYGHIWYKGTAPRHSPSAATCHAPDGDGATVTYGPGDALLTFTAMCYGGYIDTYGNYRLAWVLGVWYQGCKPPGGFCPDPGFGGCDVPSTNPSPECTMDFFSPGWGLECGTDITSCPPHFGLSCSIDLDNILLRLPGSVTACIAQQLKLIYGGIVSLAVVA